MSACDNATYEEYREICAVGEKARRQMQGIIYHAMHEKITTTASDGRTVQKPKRYFPKLEKGEEWVRWLISDYVAKEKFNEGRDFSDIFSVQAKKIDPRWDGCRHWNVVEYELDYFFGAMHYFADNFHEQIFGTQKKIPKKHKIIP